MKIPLPMLAEIGGSGISVHLRVGFHRPAAGGCRMVISFFTGEESLLITLLP